MRHEYVTQDFSSIWKFYIPCTTWDA